MTVKQYSYQTKLIPNETLAAYRDIPTAVASDCLTPGQTMVAGISPLSKTMRICGQARTAECPAGDNSAIRAALGLANTGDVIVVDAQEFEDTAVFGGLMTLFAKERGVGGLIIDGAVRDSDEIIEADLAMFARAICSGGPQKNGEGYVDGPVAVGGVAVHPGDLILGDADGVTVVPYAQIDSCMMMAKIILKKEAAILETLKKGGSLADIYGKVELTPVGRG